MKKITISIFMLFMSVFIYGQELPEIVPLSPNAAEIAKYGEIPISHFTGIPNVSIPLYNIKSGSLDLPLSLSYHAGGNKVESIASWVGLGWSLTTIPSISRSIRGIADEDGGYFSKYSGKTVNELMELPEGNNLLDTYRHDLFEGTVDSEPDIFYYNIVGESGKFFYNQETETFITYPRSNTKIIRENSNFRIIDKNGVEYLFNFIETNSSSGTTQSPSVKTTWYASKIESSDKKDRIRITYQSETYLNNTQNVTVKHHKLAEKGATAGNGIPTNQGSILMRNRTVSQVPDSIIFSNGYVKFNRSSQTREDLQGAKSLKNISIYDIGDHLIQKYEFDYSYQSGGGGISGTPCYNADDFSKKWMFLDKVSQVSKDLNNKLEHVFTYDKTNIPPCRRSAAQDYWGFYNGETTNKSLTPPYYIPNVNTIYVDGAKRGVNPSKSNFGILKKITYPTKGYTEFDYENNMINGEGSIEEDPLLEYSTDEVMITGDELIDWESPLSPRATYEADFTIDNPQNEVLNNRNPNGGSIVSFVIQFPGCDISNGANNCARFMLVNTSNGQIIDVHTNGRSFYLPNGTYKIRASFNQDPANYQDFIFIAKWNIISNSGTGASPESYNRYVGGLRVKEIRDYPSASLPPLVKKYKYIEGVNSEVSSGSLFGKPNFSFTDVIQYDYNGSDPRGFSYSKQFLYLKVSSTSNMQQVTHSGSFVGYKNVIEETNDPSRTGYTEYKFSHAADEYNLINSRNETSINFSGFDNNLISANTEEENSFPYIPTESKEVYRGLLLHLLQYKKTEDRFILVNKKSFNYTDEPFKSNNILPKYSSAIKWGNNITSNETYGATNGVLYNRAQNLKQYNVLSSWYQLSGEKEINYDSNGQNPVTIETEYSYDNPNHLLTTKTSTTNSKGEVMISTTKYAHDVNDNRLITENRIAEPLEVETKKKIGNTTVALSKQKTIYSDDHNISGIYLPKNIRASKGTQPIEDRIVYHSYDSDGNPTEVSKKDGTHIVYIWGYRQTQPIAKIEGVDLSALSKTTIENLQDLSDSDDDRTLGYQGKEGDLREALDALRSLPELSKAQITTYTYDPLIGVTSITDPRGYVMYYEYDNFNRLKLIKDASGNLIQETKYNYKN
ncbi:RHS repeat domain-containing protein [Tenacibaculum jejuense]|uniref:Rhs family protein n=1 Tax=Tenacibaculum jejuense TaxID=584609 RepID=A0A238UEK5_9FLAO|nr:RHS repeat domain-containing protein [Tenacibaculum jejuense]SNR17633.1 conserved protein of unknown function [Tenacibaculum jejuense]